MNGAWELDKMTCEDLEYDGYQKYDDLLTRNIKYGECWSSVVKAGIVFRRRIPPEVKYMADIIITAEDGQVIRDKLNEVHGSDLKIGYRDKFGEIMLIINSFWRTLIYQWYLFIKKLSTTQTGDHPSGKAIDLKTPRGMTAFQFYLFIKHDCNTRFNWFKVYSWGVHCSRR
jgi:hypothetical protein